MRKITRLAISSFININSFKLSNTSVFSDNGWVVLALYGKAIAKHRNGVLQITIGDYQTRTTISRLNGIPGVHVKTKKGQMYLNGEAWNGSWIQIFSWSQM